MLVGEERLQSGSEVLCPCLELTARDVRAWAAATRANAEEVCERSGAASTCGSCVQSVVDIAGDPGGVPAIVDVAKAGPHLAEVTLRSTCGGVLARGLAPGQHVVLSLRDDEGWVTRPYTVASAAEEADALVLFIRLRSDGRMSRALRAADGSLAARLWRPRGVAFDALRASRGVGFVVAGVGATPALAALRSAEGPRVCVVVAFLKAADLRLQGALEEVCASKNVQLHVVSRDERAVADAAADDGTMIAPGGASIEAAGLHQLSLRHPRMDWFLCGPPSFEQDARAELARCGVSSRRIHAERFVASGASEAVGRMRSHAEQLWSQAGLGLVALWCLWALLPHAESWVDLQTSDAWRIATGSGLLALIAWQWVFPTLRARSRFDAARRLELSHRVVGALSPLALMLHQRDLGFGLLGLLSVLWIFNTVVGCCDKTMIVGAARRSRYMRYWLPAHVATSLLVTALACWHVGMVVLYRGGAS